MEFLKPIKERQKNLGDNLSYLNNGLSPYTNPKLSGIELSQGCKTCKDGTWWCLYVGYRCNSTCWYCPQGSIEDKNNKNDHPEGMQHLWIEDIKICLKSVKPKTINGISYSGGEPFLYLNKVLPFANYITKEHPDIYQWIYTNGILVDKENLEKLKDVGIKEIRFHIGATNFDKNIISKIEIASKILSRVTVETPALPETKQFLIDKNGINDLINYGVTQLNLSELYFINENQYKDHINYVYTSIVRGRHISPISSRLSSYDIIEYVVNNKLKILCNDCSHESRDAQLLTRELNKNRLLNMW